MHRSPQYAVAMLLLCISTAASSDGWIVVKNWNALGIGPSPETVKDLAACEKKAEGHEQFSFNEDSKHCYVSDSKSWGGKANDHVTSGCLIKDVKGCGNQPGPTPAPPGPQPTPSPPAPVPSQPTPVPHMPVYDGQIRDEGDGLQAAYMVPAGSDNHAATIEQLPDGSLVGAWFAGDHEEASGLAIAVSRLEKGSTAWTNSTLVAKRDKFANQNPLLFYDNTTGTLHLWHTQAPADSGEGGSQIYRLTSKDGGVSWSDSKKYFKDVGVFTRNRIIRRKDQTLFWPYYSTGWKGSNGKCPVFAWSDSKSVPEDGDSGWTKRLMDQGDARLEQPTCWRLPHDTGKIECYFRDCDQKSIYVADSEDEGKTFSKPKATKLPNPGSGIEGYPLMNGDIVLIFNPTTDDKRDPLAAGISTDDGKSWVQRNVQDGPSGMASQGGNEFAYPTVLQTGDGRIHVMYTYGGSGFKKTIKYISFTEDWVMKKRSGRTTRSTAPPANNQ